MEVQRIGKNCRWWSSYCKMCDAAFGKCDGKEECWTSYFEPIEKEKE